MWRIIHGSVQGTSHQRSLKPCQDYCAGCIVHACFGDVVIAACSDGAGSAEFSQVGAKLAVDTFISLACDAVVKGDFSSDDLKSSLLLDWNTEVRRRIEAEAEQRAVPSRQLACTLLSAILGPGWSVFSQIGDGVIVFDAPEGFQFAFWPTSGEYVNTTRFITDLDYEVHLGFDRLERAVSEIAILTDGLQTLALNYADGLVHDRFFRPMFDDLSRAPSVEAAQADLMTFLDSARVNLRSDDDKSLLLATRRLNPDHDQASPPETG